MVMYGRKKSNKSKPYNFSKYDNEGRVTYSESKGSYGELVQHHYKYDNLGRRVYYAEYTDYSITMEETKMYIDNLTYVDIMWYKEKVYMRKIINSMGRELLIKTINLNDYTSETKTYDTEKCTYSIEKGYELFVPSIA